MEVKTINGYTIKDETARFSISDIKNKSEYYDEITVVKERHYDTDCYFTIIPKNDNDNNEIVLYVDEVEEGSTPTKYARDNNTSFTINASLYLGTSVGSGSVIANGEILENEDLSSKSDVYKYLGFKNNRVLKEYQANGTSAQDMIDDGCLQAFLVYYTLIKDGVIQDMTLIPDLDGDIAENKHPRQCLGQTENGTIIILSCDGRTNINAGLTSEETAILLDEKGCVNAWNLDGGGSTSTTIKGCKINRNIDDKGTTDRFIRHVLNAKKTIFNEELAKLYSKIGYEKQQLIQQIIPYINDLYSITSTKYYTNLNLNNIIGENVIGYTNGFEPKPYGNYGGLDTGIYFINIAHAQPQYKDLYNFQLIMRRDYKEIYTRRQVNGDWTDWSPVNANNITFLSAHGGDNSVNEITTTNTYQDIKFFLKETNNDIITFTNYLENDDENFSTVTLDEDYVGYVKLNFVCTFNVVTIGRKYIKIIQGATEVALVRVDCDSTGQYNISAIGMARVKIDNSHDFKVQMYGTQGDYLNGANLLIETDR